MIDLDNIFFNDFFSPTSNFFRLRKKKFFGLKNVIDFGGGEGLLCRMLRDYGANCYVMDKYREPTYGEGFTEPDFKSPDLLLAFELLEHFPSLEKWLKPRLIEAKSLMIGRDLIGSGYGFLQVTEGEPST
mgnify:CR=1 FL=1